MADQDYPSLYADLEDSSARARAAAIAFETMLGGTKDQTVPVNGFPNQPTLAGRVSAAVDAAVAALIAGGLNSQTVNRGAAFPLRQMNRGGTTSTANPVFNNLILDVKVIGDEAAIEGKYFRIGYFQNDATIAGNADQGIVIEQFDAATYASTGTATIINNHTDAPAAIVRTGGVQTFVIVPPGAPLLRFLITIDAAFLPAAGTPLSALTSALPHYSWIIDPACYIRLPGLNDAIRINKYRVFPQKQMARNGATSAAPSAFMRTILDVQVQGARPGKYYRIAYFKNGLTTLPGPADGWVFEELDALNYESAANAALTVVNYTDPAPAITRSGVQTVVIDSPVVPGLSFRVTLDTTALPTYGTQIASNLAFQDGYSYIIDPQRYVLAFSSGASGSLPIQWSMDAAGNLRVAWASKGSCYRLKIGLNGVNALANIISYDWAPGSDLNSAVWTELNTTGSDWLPPLQVAALQNGDGGTLAFTGGAHGSTGGADGSPTARSVLFQPFADGVPIVVGTVASGRAECVSLQIVNELMGYNTKSSGRYILRQAFAVDIRPGSFIATAKNTALEPISVVTDYALQGITFGFQGTQLVLGGQNTAREPFVNGQSRSGSKAAYPNAWAVVFQENTHGQMALWMDKEYGDGDGKYVDPAGVLVRGEATTKWYLGVVLPAITGTPVGHEFAKGAGYKYRAGLSWQGPDMQPAGFDSVIAMHLNGAQTFAYGLPDASFVRVS